MVHMCVSTPLCNAWAITHYIEDKEQGKHALVVRSACAVPSFLLFCRDIASEEWVADKRIRRCFFVVYSRNFQESCSALPEGCVLLQFTE